MKYKPSVLGNCLLCIILCLNLSLFFSLPNLFSPSTQNLSATSNKTELRGVWLTNVSSGVLFGPWSINRAIDGLSQLNFNTIYPVAWNRGYTFYPSSVAQSLTGYSQEPFLSLMRGKSDVLAEIVTLAHEKRLRVLPWFEYGFMVPANSPLAKTHPHWLTKNQQGKYFLRENKTDDLIVNDSNYNPKNIIFKLLKLSHTQRVKQLVWLNPFHPEVQKFIKSLILEVVMDYDIDGIQLDDHFGLPVELGYDSVTVKLYQLDHRGKKPPKDPRNPEWMRWRAAKLTALMTDIVKTVKNVHPDVKISLSPNSHHFSYQNYLQDWLTWVKRGLVDELIVQVYRDDFNRFQQDLSQPAIQFSRTKIPVSVGILSGTWNHPVPSKQIEQQVNLVRDRGFAGVSFFYWETLWGYLTPESPSVRRFSFRRLFGEKALVPTYSGAVGDTARLSNFRRLG